MRVGAFGIGGKGRDGESRRQAEAAKRVFSCAVPPSDKIDVFVERHLADALTGGRKDRIGQCGRGGGQAGFTNTMDLVAIGVGVFHLGADLHRSLPVAKEFNRGERPVNAIARGGIEGGVKIA